MTPPPEQAETSLAELALLFLRLGTTAFGGPAAHLAMMRDEVVRRRRWLTDERFLDLLGATNLIPGPNSTEMAIHFVALSGPLVPRVRASRVAGAFLDGVNVASLALMAVVSAQLARAAIVDAPTAALALVGAVALLRFGLGSTWLVLGGAAWG